MSLRCNLTFPMSSEQEVIRAKCFHPSGCFDEFSKEEIEQSIPQRFEEIVRRYPGRIAVKTASGTLTYEALNNAANRVACAILRERGDRAEPIALLFEQGAEAISAMLGVLKAGKIYVPLDPSLPASRNGYILEDSQAAALLTNRRNLSLAEELVGERLPRISVDSLDAGLSPDNIGLPISPDRFTWILYTSGSTGQPKGVVQNHRNVLHFVRIYTNGFHLCPEDRLTVLSSFSVNAGNHDIFTALLNGASLYPLNIQEVGVGQLAGWLIRHEITFYHSAPTVFRHFLDSLTREEKFSSVRLIRFGGESASKRDLDLYRKFFADHCIFVNRLGSTETGTVRWYFIDKDTEIKGNIVPVGYPVEDNEILLLDDDGKEAGMDNTGEIAVRSRYLSPGYWRRPDLTRAVYLPTEGEERVYRTGDLGRLLPDGCLVHLGRKDFQVKVRGHRIELAEIEMALLDHPIIKEAVVVAREDPEGDRRLVAYLLAAARPAPSASELRSFLNDRLPDSMIPSAWVFLEAFPLAPNGKVDRRALPPPSTARPELDTRFAPPRTPVESVLAGIWSEVLCVDAVGIHDDFFELGGHSLAATRVLSRVRDRLDIEIPLPIFFDNPTIARLAEILAMSKQKKS